MPTPIQPAGPPTRTLEPQAVLRTSGLSKRYGGLVAVDRLSITVRRGEIYGFLGRNGAGKTTTIRMLMGIVASDGGHIEYFGEAVDRPAVRHKRRVGYVSQEQHFYRWMNPKRLGRFVAGFYPTWSDEAYRRLLRAFDIPADRRASALSQGTRVKLALALALAHEPELLVLDEPTAGLDPVARREFLNIVTRQARAHARTTFFSSHIVEEVERVSDRVGVIDGGRLCYEGRVERLVAEVRRVEEPLEALPSGFTRVGTVEDRQGRGLAVRAAPGHWAEAPFASERMTLEDIFLAMVLEDTPRLP